MSTEVRTVQLTQEESEAIAKLSIGDPYNFRGQDYIFTAISDKPTEWKEIK